MSVDNVRLEPGYAAERSGFIGGPAGYLQSGVGTEPLQQRGPPGWRGVDDQHPNRDADSLGRRMENQRSLVMASRSWPWSKEPLTT